MGQNKAPVAACVGIAVWILATPTVGEQLNSQLPILTGFAVALLAGATLLCLEPGRGGVTGDTSSRLVICGTICSLAAVGLQFYLASVTAESSRAMLEALKESSENSPTANFRINTDYPPTVQNISYLATMFGIWLGAMGAWCGMMPTQSTSADGSAHE